MELLEYFKVEDVTSDGLVVRKVLKRADRDEYRSPNEGAKVVIKYTATSLEDGKVLDQKDEMEFITEEGERVARGRLKRKYEEEKTMNCESAVRLLACRTSFL